MGWDVQERVRWARKVGLIVISNYPQKQLLPRTQLTTITAGIGARGRGEGGSDDGKWNGHGRWLEVGVASCTMAHRLPLWKKIHTVFAVGAYLFFPFFQAFLFLFFLPGTFCCFGFS